MSAFTTQFGLPPINYTREVHGTNPGINGAEAEAELDIQWSHAAAPGASIVFHLGSYIVDDITGAVNDNQCGAISISSDFCGPSPSFINGVIDPLFQQAAAQGQSVFVSSGDQGAAGFGYDPITNSCVAGSSPSVNEMSADPNVRGVDPLEQRANGRSPLHHFRRNSLPPAHAEIEPDGFLAPPPFRSRRRASPLAPRPSCDKRLHPGRRSLRWSRRPPACVRRGGGPVS